LARDGMDIVGHTTTTSMPHPIRPSSLTVGAIIPRVGQACKVPSRARKHALGDPEASHRVAFAKRGDDIGRKDIATVWNIARQMIRTPGHGAVERPRVHLVGLDRMGVRMRRMDRAYLSRGSESPGYIVHE